MDTTGAGDAAGNTLHITERDYEFQVEGELTAGSVSIAVENLGAEIHEIGMAKLVDGQTVEEVRAALETAGEDEDPLEGLVEDDSVIDELGGVQAPGTAYTISGGGIEAGEYVLVCFIPNSEGVLHAQLGMVSGFSIAEGDADQARAPDVTYTISDDDLDGPTELAAGDTAIEIVNDSSTTREITLFKVKEGSTLDDVGAFFEAADEGPPDFASGPIEFLAFVFDGGSDRTISVDRTGLGLPSQTSKPRLPVRSAASPQDRGTSPSEWVCLSRGDGPRPPRRRNRRRPTRPAAAQRGSAFLDHPTTQVDTSCSRNRTTRLPVTGQSRPRQRHTDSQPDGRFSIAEAQSR